jgi:hypothetical protein
MGKIKGLVTDMGYDSAKRYLEEIKRKLERDKKRSKHAVSNEEKGERYEATTKENR